MFEWLKSIPKWVSVCQPNAVTRQATRTSHAHELHTHDRMASTCADRCRLDSNKNGDSCRGPMVTNDDGSWEPRLSFSPFRAILEVCANECARTSVRAIRMFESRRRKKLTSKTESIRRELFKWIYKLMTRDSENKFSTMLRAITMSAHMCVSVNALALR